jgi:hypothetical protein
VAGASTTSRAFDSALTVTNGRTLKVTGNETIGGTGGFALTLDPGGTHTVMGTLTVSPTGLLTINGGTLNVGSMSAGGGFQFIAGTMNVNQAGATIASPINTGNPTTINITANNVSLGSASSFVGFNHLGVLSLGANTVTLNSAGYARLGTLTSLTGGTIHAATGVAFAAGSNFQGSGTVNARVAGEAGAVIEAGGALALGAAASPAGFNYDGELRTRQFAVTLHSSAAVGLGNLTTLGNGASPGTLHATNGFVVDFDEAVTGVGTINSTNTLAKRATINGTVQGNSMAQPITLSGYIKGVGSLSNVNFTGTYSPGLSPSVVTAGNILFANGSTLVMELGGTMPGSGYDQIQSSGVIAFDGTLEVALIDGFVPAAGQSFNLFDWVGVSGAFDTLQLPALPGLSWNTSQLYVSGVLSVTAAAGVSGDYNDNGVVDAADYVMWRKLNGTSTVMANDPNPLPIDGDQYNTWRDSFGASGSGSGGEAAPEPASSMLMMILGVVACGWRWRWQASGRFDL